MSLDLTNLIELSREIETSEYPEDARRALEEALFYAWPSILKELQTAREARKKLVAMEQL